MNFYNLSGKLKMPVEKLMSLYQELFPNVKIFSYTNELLKNEVKILTEAIRSSYN
jgi:hypothetical protein